MKILIAVPTFESIYPDVFKAIYDLDDTYASELDPVTPNEYIFEYIRGYDCATARNNIVITAQQKQADYILMVDNDVIIPKNTIELFLDDPKDVCLGFYAHRDTDNIYRGRTCICKLKDDRGNIHYNYPLESEYTDQEMRDMRNDGIYKVEVHGGGMGCAFIKTEVFDKLKYPWYDWVNYDDKNRGMLSEDLYFCEQCKFKKIKIYTDTRVGCKHILRHAQDVMGGD